MELTADSRIFQACNLLHERPMQALELLLRDYALRPFSVVAAAIRALSLRVAAPAARISEAGGDISANEMSADPTESRKMDGWCAALREVPARERGGLLAELWAWALSGAEADPAGRAQHAARLARAMEALERCLPDPRIVDVLLALAGSIDPAGWSDRLPGLLRMHGDWGLAERLALAVAELPVVDCYGAEVRMQLEALRLELLAARGPQPCLTGEDREGLLRIWAWIERHPEGREAAVIRPLVEEVAWRPDGHVRSAKLRPMVPPAGARALCRMPEAWQGVERLHLQGPVPAGWLASLWGLRRLEGLLPEGLAALLGRGPMENLGALAVWAPAFANPNARLSRQFLRSRALPRLRSLRISLADGRGAWRDPARPAAGLPLAGLPPAAWRWIWAAPAARQLQLFSVAACGPIAAWLEERLPASLQVIEVDEGGRGEFDCLGWRLRLHLPMMVECRWCGPGESDTSRLEPLLQGFTGEIRVIGAPVEERRQAA